MKELMKLDRKEDENSLSGYKDLQIFNSIFWFLCLENSCLGYLTAIKAVAEVLAASIGGSWSLFVKYKGEIQNTCMWGRIVN